MPPHGKRHVTFWPGTDIAPCCGLRTALSILGERYAIIHHPNENQSIGGLLAEPLTERTAEHRALRKQRG